jgi:hypothetical protein
MQERDGQHTAILITRAALLSTIRVRLLLLLIVDCCLVVVVWLLLFG